MLRTIIVSDYVHVQGAFVRALAEGDIIVSTGSREFSGRPINFQSLPKLTANASLRTAGSAV